MSGKEILVLELYSTPICMNINQRLCFPLIYLSLVPLFFFVFQVSLVMWLALKACLGVLLTLRFVGCLISIVYLFSYVGFSFFSFCQDVLRCLLCCLYGHICIVLGMNVLAYLILME